MGVGEKDELRNWLRSIDPKPFVKSAEDWKAGAKLVAIAADDGETVTAERALAGADADAVEWEDQKSS